MTRLRPVALIRHELDTALASRRRYLQRTSADPLVLQMRSDNERDIERLEHELAQAVTGDLELSLDGGPVTDHQITVPYFNRVTETLQAAYRAIYRSLKANAPLRRGEATLAIAGTAPGSFKVTLTSPSVQLELLDATIVDRTLSQIVDLLTAAEQGAVAGVSQQWAERSSEPSVRAMIRLASTLASSRGTTKLRWRSLTGGERLATVSASAARELATSLAGQTGREIITVDGHLQMAQDEPPRVRVRTPDDTYLAVVRGDELLDRVKALLFDEVRVTLVIDQRTSPTTGSPDTDIELMDLEPVPR